MNELTLEQKAYYDSRDLKESSRWRDIICTPRRRKRVRSTLLEIEQRFFSSRKAAPTWADVGCGLGETYLVASRLGYTYTGIDVSEKHIASCRNRFPEGNWSCEDWLSHGRDYDLITFFSSLHHFSDWRSALDKAFRSLRPGGVVLVDHEPTRLFARCYRLYAILCRRVDPRVVGQVEIHWFARPSILPSDLPPGATEYHYDFFPLLGPLKLRTRHSFLASLFPYYRKIMSKALDGRPVGVCG